MGNVKNFNEEFHTIFNSAQFSTGSHQKFALQMKTMYNLVSIITLYPNVLKCLKMIVVDGRRCIF